MGYEPESLPNDWATIQLENNNDAKATYYYQLALIEFTEFKNYEKVKEYSNKALLLKPNWGEPLILIGKAYATTVYNCTDDEFEQSAIYWVVVDKFIMAKEIDEKVNGSANELINKYSALFPSLEEIFFQGLKEGENYEINFWIKEKTVVRAKTN